MSVSEVEALWDNIRREFNPAKGYEEKCFIEMYSKIDMSRENCGREKELFSKLFMLKFRSLVT